MLKQGSGFFAMWNGIAPEQAEAFALMHTRDHLAEHLSYLGPDGILFGRRHGDGRGTLPPNFAFYALTRLERLTEPGAGRHQVHESDWFKAVRTQFRDRIAHHCRVLGSAGGGTGSAVATFLVDLGADAETGAADAMERLTRLAPVTAAHLGAVDWSVPIRAGHAPPTCPQGDERLGAVVVESFDRFALAGVLAQIGDMLGALGLVTAIRGRAHYALSYALAYEEAGDLLHFRRDRPPA
jgi:hypothetical protein